MKRLHVGCGKNYLPTEEGWTNVDVFNTVRADIYADMTALPFDRESFDEIYACHVLEHSHRHMVLATLTHWKSLLKPQGVLRLAVPDFEAVCLHYTKHKDLPVLMGLLYGGQNHPLNRHTTTFDFRYLSGLLEKAGFHNIHRWDWRTTDHSNMDDFSQCFLPHLDRNGQLMSLNVQAQK